MKYLIILGIMTTISLSVVSAALADEPIVLGCTNPNALNYNSEANKDDNTCNTGGGGNPLDVYVPLYGLRGSQITEQFVTLKSGERFGNEYCPSWFPAGCWTMIKKSVQKFIVLKPGEKYGNETCPVWFPKSGCRVQK